MNIMNSVSPMAASVSYYHDQLCSCVKCITILMHSVAHMYIIVLCHIINWVLEYMYQHISPVLES